MSESVPAVPAGALAPPKVDPPLPPALATLKQRVVTALLLLLFTVALVLVWFLVFHQIQTRFSTLTEASWDNTAKLQLKPGPPAFRYDADRKVLLYRGSIDRSTKAELAALPVVDESKPDQKAARSSYYAALDLLAFKQVESSSSHILWVFLLGGLSAVMGVTIRTITGFIGNATYKNTLDIERWWPWYVLRPFLGFLLGLVVVVLARSELFQPAGRSNGDTIWWVGVTTLVGFGSSDFTDRMRLLVQTLFGGLGQKPDKGSSSTRSNRLDAPGGGSDSTTTS